MRKTLMIILTLAGCAAKQPEIPQAQREFNQAVYQDVKNLTGKMQLLIERVYAKEMAKGRAANCPKNFNFTTGECLP